MSQSDWAGLEEVLDEQHDERKIIRCINNNDLSGLTSVLVGTNLDITKIVDENGFTLVHLAAYINSESCLKALFDHLTSSNYASDLFVYTDANKKQFKDQMTGYSKLIAREWVNRATKVTKGSQLDILSQKEVLGNEQEFLESSELNGGFTPLHYASYHGNPKLIDMLIEAGADIYAENEQSINVLHVAAQGDSPYSLAFFLRHSTLKISCQDKSLSTPLHWACISHSH